MNARDSSATVSPRTQPPATLPDTFTRLPAVTLPGLALRLGPRVAPRVVGWAIEKPPLVIYSGVRSFREADIKPLFRDGAGSRTAAPRSGMAAVDVEGPPGGGCVANARQPCAANEPRRVLTVR